MADFKHHLSLPDSGWLRLLVETFWGLDSHQSTTGFRIVADRKKLSIVFLVRGLWDPQREGVLEVTGPGLSLQELLGLSLQKPLHVKRWFGPMWKA